VPGHSRRYTVFSRGTPVMPHGPDSSDNRHPNPRVNTAAFCPFDTREVGGVPFRVATLESACDWLLSEAVPRKAAVNVRLANAYNVALANQHPRYRALLAGGGINFPDGTPVVWF